MILGISPEMMKDYESFFDTCIYVALEMTKNQGSSDLYFGNPRLTLKIVKIIG